MAVGLKYRFGYDDSLDVVGVHLVGGILGSLLIGFFASGKGQSDVEGLFYGGGLDQFWKQCAGVFGVLAYSLVVSAVLAFLLDKTIGMRVCRHLVQVSEALEAEGLVTRLLPDWERVRCRPQRNAVHLWTVDRHLIETAVRAAGFTRRVHRPDLLLVAALLHDIGKGWPGDHSVAGETIARDVATRIGFDHADAAVLATLVRHHLLLVETATRRDLDDPATVRAVADAVGTEHTLELLHALTEADALATGPAAWSSWRASLVADLVKRVAGVLAGEPPAEPAAAAPTAEQERLAVEAFRTGGPVLALRAQTEAPITGSAGSAMPDAVAADGPEPLGVELLIAVPDQAGVLPAVAGVLAMHRLTVRTAELRSLPLPDGVEGSVLLLDWRVTAQYGSLPQAARLRARPGQGPGRHPGHRRTPRRTGRGPPQAPGRRTAPAPRHRHPSRVPAGHGDRGPGAGRPGAAVPARAGAGGGGSAGAERARVHAGGERGGRVRRDAGRRGAVAGGHGGVGGPGAGGVAAGVTSWSGACAHRMCSPHPRGFSPGPLSAAGRDNLFAGPDTLEGDPHQRRREDLRRRVRYSLRPPVSHL
ncbi:Bifunctional uridylyltransferase/uridylyl-removing enzyme [Streptomyces violaceorubidus]